MKTETQYKLFVWSEVKGEYKPYSMPFRDKAAVPDILKRCRERSPYTDMGWDADKYIVKQRTVTYTEWE